ncbi:hypothetical protein PpBr36_02047 [Pyricularia pennisetigena]|uniref:hypothetical protein n=1 Tax=Pyricularia pennisetigena TaxID=1578925 RepID=UPI001150D223|nr:hypothetical protein PpBr36_02047 [Pyricularia pennisetigena]TLS27821.1 hypothetical protein PpBr36_02047 [Pyricularia pennisetigena]
MEFLRRLFWAKTSPTWETDEVFPLTLIDNLAAARNVVLSESLRFDQALDATILSAGLTELIHKNGDWRKLGGRLRLRPDGSLEIHVPREFTEERPAFHFTSQTFDIAIEEHALDSQLPKLTDGPSLQPGPASFDRLNPIPDKPSKLDDYIYSDRPILRLHVTSFTNSSIVTLIWSHVVFGGGGMKQLIAAWSKVLHGRQEVPPLLGAHKDVLAHVGTNADAAAPFLLGPSEIKRWGLVKLVFGLLWELWRHPTVETRAMYLPRGFVSQLRQACLRELRAVYRQDPAAFISEGDVLEAWCSRFVARARGDEKPVLIMNAIDVRDRLTAPWGVGGVYVQNTAVCTWTSVTAEGLLRRPLGELAYTIRRSIQELATDEQLRAQLRIFRSLGHTKMIPLFGDPGSRVMNFSNFTKFDLFEVADLGPAVISPSSPTRSDASACPTGKPVYMHCGAVGDSWTLRNCFNITGKDWDGSYWITAHLYPEDWAKLEEYMQQTQQRIGEQMA